MFNSTILDVAICLIFIFLLFSLLCSVIKELIAAGLNLRGKMLVKGIASLLDGLSAKYKLPLPLPKGGFDTEEFRKVIASVQGMQPILKSFLESDVVTGQSSTGLFGKVRMPSYLSDSDFSAALLHTLFGMQNIGSLSLAEVHSFFESSSLPDDAKAPLVSFLTLIDRGEKTLQENICKWYNAGMDRVTGWYKRQTQWILLMIAFVFTVAFNVDSIELAKRAYHDTPLRASIISSVSRPLPNDSSALEQYKHLHTRIDELDLPIGWIPNPIANFDILTQAFWQKVLEKLPGFLLTTLAISLGAPFWFDILNRVMNIRYSGSKPEKSS